MARWMSIVGLAMAAQVAAAQPDPALDRLERALPAGWTMLTSGSELVLRHDRPCYATGARHDRTAAVEARDTGGDDRLVTLELRYRLEPRWSAARLAAARATNDKLAAELRALEIRYRIAAIRTGKGGPAPASADERARLTAYTAARDLVTARLVKLPVCSLGAASMFDSATTYAMLELVVDPPEVMTEAHRVVELVKAHCE